MRYLIVIAISIMLITSSIFYAQCSDAGACSIDSQVNMDDNDNQKKYSLGFNYTLSGNGKTYGFSYSLFILNGGIVL